VVVARLAHRQPRGAQLDVRGEDPADLGGDPLGLSRLGRRPTVELAVPRPHPDGVSGRKQLAPLIARVGVDRVHDSPHVPLDQRLLVQRLERLAALGHHHVRSPGHPMRLGQPQPRRPLENRQRR
jgi:hypothetical protein